MGVSSDPSRRTRGHIISSSLVPGFLRTQYVIDIENVVAVLVVVTVIFQSLAGLRKDTTWVSRRLVFEARVANTICSREVDR